MPGDFVFILGGVLPFLWITWLGVRHGIKATTTEMPPETLFVEEHSEAEEDRTGMVRGRAADATPPIAGTRQPDDP